MTLDLIVWVPEAFVLLCLLVLLCYGSGPSVSPVIEGIYYLDTKSTSVWHPQKGIVNELSGNDLTTFLNLPAAAELQQSFAPDIRTPGRLHWVLARPGVRTPGPSGPVLRPVLSPVLRRLAGPLHIASHMNSWAITVCLLMALLVWYTPLQSLQAGGLFLRDLFVTELLTFVWLFAIACLLTSHSWQKSSGIIHLEYTYLVVFFLLGVHLLIISTDLISLYGSLELQSFSIVVLCSLNYGSAYLIEALMKYFLLSAFSSSLLLLGIGLIYWQTGLTRLSSLQELLTYTTNDILGPLATAAKQLGASTAAAELQQCLRPVLLQGEALNPALLLEDIDSVLSGIPVLAPLNLNLQSLTSVGDLSIWLGLWLIGLALLWKLALAPLHMWAADVYMGAWSSVTLLVSTLPKIAVLCFWAHYFLPLWSGAFGSAVGFFSAMSLIIGGIAPLAQSQFKRLLLFSSVGHMGFLLMPFALIGASYAFSALWAHLFFYVLTSLVVWALIQWPFNRPSTLGYSAFYRLSGPQYIWDLVSLNRTSPAALLAWAVLMLSLAGLPPVAGFLGKLFLFWASLSSDQYLLVLLLLISTLLSSVYYLRVLVVSFVYNKGYWGSYAPFYSISAYIVVIVCTMLVLSLWYLAPLVILSHLLALAS
uniref:NADH dehydrogenase subunit 2 n=1 Tax=Lacunastrum gracillimum TaxID=427913 RepID=A0A2Z4EL17_9CHLO|nr:NADH dehydrogenase subunit 2 [Lacunastrum gracillimum]